MRILILSQYFSPEIGATQTRVHGFASELAARGHDVEVVCGVPNHPQGVVHPGYGGKPLDRRTLDGFRASYVWVRTRPEKSNITRLAYYGSYAAMATAVGATLERPDVVLASSPPLPVAAAGAAVARVRGVPWVMDVRDLWPAAAIAMGELAPGRALDMLTRLERHLYRSAQAITVVTRPFQAEIEASGAGAGKVHLIPNGTTSFWLEATDVPPDRPGLNLSQDEFLWTFAGNVGKAQGLEAAIDAADLLGPGFRLLIVGDGPAKANLQALAAERPRAAIEFREQVSPDVARRTLRSSDALIVPLAADPILEDFVPSKLFDFCATGVPVICSAAGEAARLTGQRGAALISAPGDARSLADAVRRLHDSAELGSDLARAGAEFALENLRADQITNLERILIGAVEASPGN